MKNIYTKIIKDVTLKDKILGEVKSEIFRLEEIHHKRPGIAFVGFMGVPLGKYNIPFHVQLAEELGFQVFNEIQPDDITEADLFKRIDGLNRNDQIHAIVLLQSLPEHLIPVRIVNRIDPRKEVEGFHPLNMMGTLMPDIVEESYPMCLPTALHELFKSNAIQVKEESEWVLLLDDEFFSNQLVNMVTRTAFTRAVPKDCILTIINRNSQKLIEHCRRADYLVKEVPSKKDPGRLVSVIRGGVNVESVLHKAGAILPIPGGLMSVVLAILLRNALTSFVNTIQTPTL
ncbi:MAG: hypothetical protein HQ565_08640 [Bacteroidetes bacterium]|nr:hypothetical protein [Bacteroidota bacterium]